MTGQQRSRVCLSWYTRVMKKEIVTIHFSAPLYKLKTQTILRLPAPESEKLPSRGQVAVTGTMNGTPIRTVLEPDGYWGHWLRVDADMQKSVGVAAGDTVDIEITPTKDWPEPTLPKDLKDALAVAPQKVQTKWKEITPMARWEWIRWMNATLSHETRAIRIEKTISKLNGKHRRPCCFNLAACTDPELSKSARLVDAAAM